MIGLAFSKGPLIAAILRVDCREVKGRSSGTR